MAGAGAAVRADARADLLHGTTVATNALLERRGARTLLVTDAGFESLIEIARQDRPSLYDPFADRPRPLAEPEMRLGVEVPAAGRDDELDAVAASVAAVARDQGAGSGGGLLDVLVRGPGRGAGAGRPAPPRPRGAGVGLRGGSGRVQGVRAVLHRSPQRLPGTGGGPLHGQPGRPGRAGRVHRRDLGHALLRGAGVAGPRLGVPRVDPAVGARRRGGGRGCAGRSDGLQHADLLRHGRDVHRRVPGAPGPGPRSPTTARSRATPA